MDINKIREDIRSDLVLFGKVIDPKSFGIQSPEFHYELSDLLLGENKFLNIIAPRGSAKTTVVGVMKTLHHLMFDEGKKVVVLVSRTQGHAINILQTIKDILDYSQPFRKLFGYWGMRSSKQWSSTQITLKDGSSIVCKGMGQQMRGLNIRGQRPTLVILDDPEDENNTKTPEAMESNLRWLLQSAEPTLDDHRGRLIVIGTPLHQRCLVETLAGFKRYITRRYKYINVDEEGNEYSLWEEKISVAELKRMKRDLEELGKVSVFYKERQCEVIGDEDQLFKPEYFRYWDGSLEVEGGETFLKITHLHKVTLNEPIKKPVNVFLGIDPASSTSERADFSVILPIAYDKDKNIYVLPFFRKRVSPTDLGNEIVKYAKMYKVKRAGIETTQYQEMLREYVRDKMRAEGIYISGLEREDGFKPRTEKNKRLEGLHPFFYNKKVFMQESMTHLIDELLLYPRAKNDDCIKENAVIKTIDGYKEVKDVRRGDLVLTHKGRYKKVKKVIEKDFEGEFCTLNPKGQLPLEISTDHKVYYAGRIYCKGGIEQYYPNYEKRDWVEAGEFKKGYRNVFITERLSENENYVYRLPKSHKCSNNEKLNELLLDKNFAKVLGYFLAEGNAYKGKGRSMRFAVSFASHTREVGKRRFIKKYFEQFGITVREETDGNSGIIVFDNRFFHHLFSQCYDKSKEKILPPYARFLGRDLKHALIWWMAGDGWTIKKISELGSNKLKSADRYCGSTSMKLVLAMRDIAFSLGYYAVIRKLKRHRYGKPTKDFYQMDLRFKPPRFSKLTKLSDFECGGSMKVQNRCEYKGKVYDLQVEDDHSFVCNGFVIHNCMDGLYYATRKMYAPDHQVKTKEDDLKHFLGVPQYRSNWKVA